MTSALSPPSHSCQRDLARVPAVRRRDHLPIGHGLHLHDRIGPDVLCDGPQPQCAGRVRPGQPDPGVPIYGLVLTFVVGLILFLPFPSSAAAGRVHHQRDRHLVRLGTTRRGRPAAQDASRRRASLPPAGGDVLTFLGFYAANMIVYWGGWDTNKKLFVTVIIGYVVLAGFHLIGDRSNQAPMAIRSGFSGAPVVHRPGADQLAGRPDRASVGVQLGVPHQPGLLRGDLPARGPRPAASA